MKTDRINISIKGKTVLVPGIQIGGRLLIVTGRMIKTAAVRGENWLPGETVGDPDALVRQLKETKTSADLFAFAQRLPETKTKYDYFVEWENVAAIRTDSFNDWWKNRIPPETRKNVRRAGRHNVIVRTVELDDRVLRGLKDIYDESPIRQGRRFWHYQKNVDAIRHENSGYLDRSELMGAYYQDELIGFLKLVYVDHTANVMQIVSKKAHFDKRATNALIARAVKICEKKGVRFLVYGRYVYDGRSASQLTEFKRRNGFEQYFVPRYYIPLTLKGRLALKFKLHRGLRAMLPGWLKNALIDMRSAYYQRTRPSRKSCGLVTDRREWEVAAGVQTQ